ncbi:dihydroorotate dehydrogenase [Neisseria macacae ATCC 33926]|uniref:Dihydroorotate dehydrogenase n=1 Tax=Neisseria macacae ATCC 33926 TaxID=997348 RepID=A0AA36UJF7_9NEIS|nr:dihydroorotate dehydrogenase [Neisseria macacae ATCC 33926]
MQPFFQHKTLSKIKRGRLKPAAKPLRNILPGIRAKYYAKASDDLPYRIKNKAALYPKHHKP